MTLVLGGLAVAIATCLAGVVGFAYGLVALPLLLALGLDLPEVVVVNLVIALVTRTATLARLRRDVSLSRSGALVALGVPGLAAGMVLLDRLDTATLTVVASVAAVAGAVLLAALGARRGSDRSAPAPVPADGRSGLKRLALAGAAGGFLGPTTSLNGIPPALVLTGTRTAARSMVADLAVYFVVGNALTLAAMTWQGRAPWGDALPLLAAWVLPALVGNAVGLRLGGRISYTWFRRTSLLVIAISGLTPLAAALV